MSNADNTSFANFGKLVPGFDFLQNLATQAAGSAAQKLPQMPSLGSWIAPTMNVEELDKRIQELKAVQFWLDQNATALKATIQALEVQKMTLATLKGMNFNMADMANAFKLKVTDSLAGGAQPPAEKPKGFAGLEVPPTSFANGDTQQAEPPQPRAAKAESAAAAALPGVVDPMQWWGALTQQFQTIAADAMKDAAKKAVVGSSQALATGLAKDAMKSVTGMASGIAKGMKESASKTLAGGARAALNTALRSSQAWPTPSTKKTAPSKPPARKKPPAVKAARKSAR